MHFVKKKPARDYAAHVVDPDRVGRCNATALRNGFQARCIRASDHDGDHVSIRRSHWHGRQARAEFREPAMQPPKRRRVQKDRYSTEPPEEVVSL